MNKVTGALKLFLSDSARELIEEIGNVKLGYIYCGRYVFDCQKKVVYDMGDEKYIKGAEIAEREK